MNCNHEPMYALGLNYCPHCGKRLISESSKNLCDLNSRGNKWAKAEPKVLSLGFGYGVKRLICMYVRRALETKHGYVFTKSRCPDVGDEFMDLCQELWDQIYPVLEQLENDYGYH